MLQERAAAARLGTQQVVVHDVEARRHSHPALVSLAPQFLGRLPPLDHANVVQQVPHRVALPRRPPQVLREPGTGTGRADLLLPLPQERGLAQDEYPSELAPAPVGHVAQQRHDREGFVGLPEPDLVGQHDAPTTVAQEAGEGGGDCVLLQAVAVPEGEPRDHARDVHAGLAHAGLPSSFKVLAMPSNAFPVVRR